MKQIILLVDDDEIIRLTTKEILTEIGYDTLVASGGEEAISIFNEKYNTINLVILDMTMPGIPGPEVFKKLKSINREIPVLITSGYNQDSEIQTLTGNGRDSFIQKPFTVMQLNEKLNSMLAG